MTPSSNFDNHREGGAETAIAEAPSAAATLAEFEHAAWALAAFVHLNATAAIEENSVTLRSMEDIAAARVLVAAGLLVHDGDGFKPSPGMAGLIASKQMPVRAFATESTLRQVATIVGIVPSVEGEGWASHDDQTLLAQGRASAFAGQMLATMAVTNLDGLAERFRDRGRFLDVGTGVGELGAAFAEMLPGATVVGLDVMPRAIELARQMIIDRHLQNRFEVRDQAIEDLQDNCEYDLAWIPAPFIPHHVFNRSLANIHNSIIPGGWIIVAAGRLEGNDLGVAVTRWQTVLAGGTAITATEAHTMLANNGFTNITTIPTPTGAPALHCGQRRPDPNEMP